MKKLITLLILFVGMVSTASADFKVYIYPGSSWGSSSPKFSLYMFNTTTNEWADFTAVDGYSGYYEATFKTKYTSLIVVRHSPSAENTHTFDNKWTQSTNLSPTLSTLYDFGSSDTNGSSAQAPSGTRPLGSWVMFGNRHIAAHNDNWHGTSTYNAMSLKDGTTHTYQLTVTNKAVKNGTYGYKFMGNGSYVVGDVTQDGWPNLNLTIGGGDGYYDIVYTLDELTLAASAVPTKKSSATLTYKYFVYDYDPAYSPVGIGNITGQRWWNNEMTDDNSDGTYTFSVSNKNLTSGKYGFKVQEEVYDGTSAIEGYGCLLNTNDLSTDEGYKTTNISKNRAYNVTFSVTPAANDYEMSASDFEITATAITSGYYFIQNPGSGWTVGDRLTESSGVWSGTLSSMANGYFAILDAEGLGSGDTDFNWSYVKRPSEATNENPKIIDFQNYTDQTIGDNGGVWRVASTNDANVTINFTPGTPNGTWTIIPSFTRTINASAGYATFSYAYAVAIPDRVDAYWGKEVTDGKIVMKKYTKGIPASVGALLSGSGEVTFTPATETDEVTAGSNLLKASVTNTELTGSSTSPYYYILGGTSAETVGFYYVNTTRNSGAGKAYLATTTALAAENANARAAWIFDEEGETTGIAAVKASQKMNGEFFNLAGQRVAQPTKGLYIVNGKKVIMK